MIAGGDLAGILDGNPSPEKDEGFCGDAGVGKPKDELGDCTVGGDLTEVFVFEKLIPPKTSARPPNASGFGAGGAVIPPKDP